MNFSFARRNIVGRLRLSLEMRSFATVMGSLKMWEQMCRGFVMRYIRNNGSDGKESKNICI